MGRKGKEQPHPFRARVGRAAASRHLGTVPNTEQVLKSIYGREEMKARKKTEDGNGKGKGRK